MPDFWQALVGKDYNYHIETHGNIPDIVALNKVLSRPAHSRFLCVSNGRFGTAEILIGSCFHQNNLP